MLDYNSSALESHIAPHFNVYIFKNHYILNEPKIASSYMDGFHKPAMAMFQDFKVTSWQESLSLKDLENLNKPRESLSIDKLITWPEEGKDFYKDWNNLLQGQPTSKKFIFLTRNPIQKFIAGLVQDFIMPENEEEMVINISERYVKPDSKSNEGYALWGFANNLHYENYEDIVFQRLGVFFNQENLINLSNSGNRLKTNTGIELGKEGYMGPTHCQNFTYWISNLVEFLDYNKNIDILDINIQSLHNTLFDMGYQREQDFHQREPVDDSNKRPDLIKKTNIKNDLRSHVKPKILNLISRYIISKRSWGDIVNKIQELNLKSWINLVNKTYNKDSIKHNSNINSYEKMFGDWYISGDDKTFDDLVNIDVHKNWCSKKNLNILHSRLQNYNKQNPNYSRDEELDQFDAADHLHIVNPYNK